VTNLSLRNGSQAVTNQPLLALLDTNSYWIDAYFREDDMGNMQVGDHAVVTLMTYPDTPLRGKVSSIAWGIAQQDGSTSVNLLPAVAPTFEWIRLAQRVPVLIHLEEVPDHINLRVGTTASVLVRAGSAHEPGNESMTPAPSALE
jgi:multidrug resistance efflux pump